MRHARRFILVCCLSLLGCAGSKPPRYYTLSGALPAAQIPVEAAARPSVGLGPVSLPESADRPQLVIRSGDNEVEIVQGHRWAEPLKQDVARLLAGRLAQKLSNPRIGPLSPGAAQDPDYRVSIDLVRLEARMGKEAIVEALWTLSAKSGGVPVTRRGLYRAAVAGAGHQDVVAAYFKALCALADDIALEVGALPAPAQAAP